MNPIASYLRHLIVTGITLLITKYKLPLEGADQFADGIALFVIATLTWAIVKYGPEPLKRLLGFSVIAFLAALTLSSCGVPVTLKTPYGRASTDAKGVLTVTPKAKPIVIPLGEK